MRRDVSGGGADGTQPPIQDCDVKMAPSAGNHALIGVVQVRIQPVTAMLGAPDQGHQNVDEERQRERRNGPDIEAGGKTERRKQGPETERASVADIKFTSKIVQQESRDCTKKRKPENTERSVANQSADRGEAEQHDGQRPHS